MPKQMPDPQSLRTVQQCREVIADAVLATSAKTVLAQLGHEIPSPPENSDPAQLRAHRMACRNAMTRIRDSIDRNKPDTVTDQKVEAMEWLAGNVRFVDQTLDLAGLEGFGASASASAGMRGGRGQPLLDSSGQRIGTILDADTLRDEHAIRNSIGAGGSGGMLDDGQMTLADFVRGVANMRTTEGVRNALSEGTDSAGGYAVPTVLLPGILQALVPASVLLSAGANIALLTDGAKSYNIAGVDTLPTPAWRNEAGSIAESDPAFRSISITPRSLAVLFKVSRELLADAPGMDQALRIVLAQAFGKALDLAGLRGSGTAPEIKGLRNMSNVNITSMGANGATPTNYQQLVAGWKAIVSANAPAPTSEIMHPRDLATFANLVDTTNQPLRRPELIAGMRQYQTSQLPTNLVQGTSGTVCSEIFQGDFTQFTWYFREQLSIQLLTEKYADTGQLAMVAHVRADCAVAYPQAFNCITGVKP